MSLYPSNDTYPANNLYPNGEIPVVFSFGEKYSKIGVSKTNNETLSTSSKTVGIKSSPQNKRFGSNL